MSEPIRFGILGGASIARKLSRAITLSPNATLCAIGSRSLEKAANFAAENNFPPNAKVCGSYDAVLDDPEVDAVYIPLPTSLHVKWAVLAANKKKHVLLEKPVALSVKEFDEIMEACEVNGVQLMDGTMWMHHPRTEKMKEFLKDADRFGKIHMVYSCFTYAGGDPDFLKNDIRLKPDLDALGCLGDQGWYCIRSILWTMDYELPKKVVALHDPIFNEAGVLISCGASLHWQDGRVATFHCSFLVNVAMDITAVGAKGTLHVDDFVIPVQENEASFMAASKTGFAELARGLVPHPSMHFVSTDLPQEVLMVREFSGLVENIKRNGAKPEKMWPDISRKTQLVIDAVKASIERNFQPVEI